MEPGIIFQMKKQRKGVKMINYLLMNIPIDKITDTIVDRLWNMTDKEFDKMIMKVNEEK